LVPRSLHRGRATAMAGASASTANTPAARPAGPMRSWHTRRIVVMVVPPLGAVHFDTRRDPGCRRSCLYCCELDAAPFCSAGYRSLPRRNHRQPRASDRLRPPPQVAVALTVQSTRDTAGFLSSNVCFAPTNRHATASDVVLSTGNLGTLLLLY